MESAGSSVELLAILQAFDEAFSTVHKGVLKAVEYPETKWCNVGTRAVLQWCMSNA